MQPTFEPDLKIEPFQPYDYDWQKPVELMCLQSELEFDDVQFQAFSQETARLVKQLNDEREKTVIQLAQSCSCTAYMPQCDVTPNTLYGSCPLHSIPSELSHINQPFNPKNVEYEPADRDVMALWTWGEHGPANLWDEPKRPLEFESACTQEFPDPPKLQALEPPLLTREMYSSPCSLGTTFGWNPPMKYDQFWTGA